VSDIEITQAANEAGRSAFPGGLTRLLVTVKAGRSPVDKPSPNVTAHVQLQGPLPSSLHSPGKQQFGPPTDGETFWLVKP
jgi:hypothetical protein